MIFHREGVCTACGAHSVVGTLSGGQSMYVMPGGLFCLACVDQMRDVLDAWLAERRAVRDGGAT